MADVQPNSYRNLSFTPIALGALVGTIAHVMFLLLGIGVGLALFRIELGQALNVGSAIAAVVYSLAAITISFLFGGYVAGRFGPHRTRGEAAFFGLGAFALAAVVVLAFEGAAAFSAAGSLLSKAGVSLGTGSGASALGDQLGKLKIVTDMSIFKGKAVTQIVAPHSPQSSELEELTKRATKQVKRVAEDREVKAEVQKAAADVRRGTAITLLVLLAHLLVGAIAATMGGRMAARRFAERAAQPDYRGARAA